MIESLILVEGQNISTEALRSMSLGNAKQLVIGVITPAKGVILQVNATSSSYLGSALLEISQVPGVTNVLTLKLENTQ
ncbi:MULTISPECIES: hypothetical protein [Bacillus cereus group]|uniref:Uncharacterized protein n=2 Tax=Bacillus cereus group TaxID=86661 RepID=A0A9X6XSU2_BACTU|nr:MULTISPECIES: hypothetical protein [Bacillus cereus group]EJP85570.1 hypothetical protein IC1_04608 [Bacillus cereus VD022]EOQ58115.1 hypothetical protein IAY_04140 [Bacillus cereus TIAC219]MCU4804857.1 hypothetical protein [Bacillus cereus]MCU4819698.1 hypothetical protein [Bacillus cereus]MCU5086797.1 hypothetical protein [Bacillus cereus]